MNDTRHADATTPDDLRTSLAASGIDLQRVWAGVAGDVWARPIGPIERLAGRLLRSPGLARALVTTPSLVLSWLLASAGVLAVGVLATQSTGTPWVALIAPALAGIGVAYAYGPGVDPAFELARTMPISDRIILLVRSFAVCGTDVVLGLVASLLAGQALGLTLGWLLPMTAISALALAAATLARSANVGVAAGLTGWTVVVLGSTLHTRNLGDAIELANGMLAPVYALATLACLALALWATNGRRMERVQWS
jgi:hypothetical protein